MSGADAGRMFEVMGLLEEHHPDAACCYLNLLGVDPAQHGGGLGSTLLARAWHGATRTGSRPTSRPPAR